MPQPKTTTSDNSAGALDLAIIGSGPAALSAALYATRASLKVTVFERGKFGGALTEIDNIENYPGFTGPGNSLAANMEAQATKSGANLVYGECSDIIRRSSHFELTIDGEPVKARAVLVATGSEPRSLSFSLEKPVSYCALCDGALVKNQHVAVVGGANSAVQEALYLSSLAKNVTIISHSALRADPVLLDRLRGAGNIEIRENLEPTPDILNTFDHVFVYIGKVPATSCLKELASSLLEPGTLLTPDGYVIASGDTKETVIPGLFAAGDVRFGAIRQVVTASAEGAAAAIEIERYLLTNSQNNHNHY